ncbi:hypothetical protein BGX20_004958, partial [Mortierella sp. AD010]
GELSVKETRKERLLQETAFAFKEHNIRSRKVDLLFQAVYKDHKGKEVRKTLAVFEAKCATASTDILRVQVRKNLRLNKTLLANLRIWGCLWSRISDRQNNPIANLGLELFALLGRLDLNLLLKVANRLQSLDTLVRMAALNQEEQVHHRTTISTSSGLAAQDSPSVTTVWSPSTV